MAILPLVGIVDSDFAVPGLVVDDDHPSCPEGPYQTQKQSKAG